jgi:hypothetical protein
MNDFYKESLDPNGLEYVFFNISRFFVYLMRA